MLGELVLKAARYAGGAARSPCAPRLAWNAGLPGGRPPTPRPRGRLEPGKVGLQRTQGGSKGLNDLPLLRTDDLSEPILADAADAVLASVAERWDALLERCGLEPEQLEQMRASEAHGPLLAALRDAEVRGLDVEAALPKIVAARPLADAEDTAAVLHVRVERWVAVAASKRKAATNLIAGLIPRAAGVADLDMARALHERDRAMERRARELADEVIERGQVWVRRLGTPPTDPVTREAWIQAVSTVAAYRDRWGVDTDHRPLGPESAVKTIEAIEAIGHRKRVQAAIERALHLAGEVRGGEMLP